LQSWSAVVFDFLGTQLRDSLWCCDSISVIIFWHAVNRGLRWIDLIVTVLALLLVANASITKFESPKMSILYGFVLTIIVWRLYWICCSAINNAVNSATLLEGTSTWHSSLTCWLLISSKLLIFLLLLLLILSMLLLL